jgi:hypothetical protein
MHLILNELQFKTVIIELTSVKQLLQIILACAGLLIIISYSPNKQFIIN